MSRAFKFAQAFFTGFSGNGRKSIFRKIKSLENAMIYGENLQFCVKFPRSFLQKLLNYDEKSLSYAEFWP